jgi:hypothetical protein
VACYFSLRPLFVLAYIREALASPWPVACREEDDFRDVIRDVCAPVCVCVCFFLPFSRKQNSGRLVLVGRRERMFRRLSCVDGTEI